MNDLSRPPLLELKHIRKDFGGLRAVDNVSMSVPPGAIIGLIGPNGSGKSTLVNLIAGSIDLTGGQVIFEGADISKLSADAVFHRGIARGWQEPALYFKMTVLDNLLLPVKGQRGEQPWHAPRWGAWREEERAHAEAAMDVLRQVQLLSHYDALASDLSGGQMKLLEIARALMAKPKLLLLDEPTAGVAPKLAYDIFEQIARLRDDHGITLLIIEHRLEILFDFVDEVYVMHLGNLLAQGSTAEISDDARVREVYFGD